MSVISPSSSGAAPGAFVRHTSKLGMTAVLTRAARRGSVADTSTTVPTPCPTANSTMLRYCRSSCASSACSHSEAPAAPASAASRPRNTLPPSGSTSSTPAWNIQRLSLLRSTCCCSLERNTVTTHESPSGERGDRPRSMMPSPLTGRGPNSSFSSARSTSTSLGVRTHTLAREPSSWSSNSRSYCPQLQRAIRRLTDPSTTNDSPIDDCANTGRGRVPSTRSAMAFAFGGRTGERTVLIPIARAL